VCGASVPASPEPFGAPAQLCPACEEQAGEQPQPVPGYRIVRELGRGGMGVVYLAVDAAGGGLVALKTILPAVRVEKADLKRFLREARILQELEHPNIVAFRDVGEAQGRLFFAMDYVPGKDAAHLLEEHGPLPIKRAAGLVCQLLDALAYAHGKGFVHRDIKPNNMLVTEERGREVVKLADFGLARVYQASQMSGLTLAGDVGGTPAFLAPEQITHFREAKPAADQYSAAATLYTLLTGRFVFDSPRQNEAQLVMILHDKPVPIRSRRQDVPEKLAAVIHRALAKEPGERFPDVGAMRKALLPFGR
jgi:serine/threonine-protein kinase